MYWHTSTGQEGIKIEDILKLTMAMETVTQVPQRAQNSYSTTLTILIWEAKTIACKD